jgi:hypothetical protein
VLTPQRYLGSRVAFDQGRPVYAVACPDGPRRLAHNTFASDQGRRVFAFADCPDGLRRLGLLVGQDQGRRVFAMACCPAGSGSGSGSVSASPSASASLSRSRSLSPSAPSAASAASLSVSAPASASGSASASASGSGSGSGSGSVVGIATACCELPVPLNLLGTVTDKTGQCVCIPDEILLVYDGLFTQGHTWGYDIDSDCGGDCEDADPALVCDPDTGTWTFNTFAPEPGGSCGPFDFTFVVTSASGDSYTVRVTEVP